MGRVVSYNDGVQRCTFCGKSEHEVHRLVAGAGVALGAKVVEKHLTLRRADGGADAAFSMEPEEFKEMVDHIRMIEKAVG